LPYNMWFRMSGTGRYVVACQTFVWKLAGSSRGLCSLSLEDRALTLIIRYVVACQTFVWKLAGSSRGLCSLSLEDRAPCVCAIPDVDHSGTEARNLTGRLRASSHERLTVGSVTGILARAKR